MKNHELLFKKFVGVVHEDSTDAMSRFLDGEEEIQQDVTQTPGVDDAPPEEVPAEEMPPEDEAMMDDEFAPPGPPEMVDPNISETQKQINLLDLYLTLKQDGEQFKEIFERCDFSEVDEKYHHRLSVLEDGVMGLYKKIVLYIADNFQYETYEKSLYIYLMLRKELTILAQDLNAFMAQVKKEKDEEKKG